ncbi:MAG: LamG domain-containing protein [Actinobacteria bacterium]|nr:LamG domain-containing protein [Actinomycetota bacterium]MCL5446850.1 LamG domain-containing protein [Actinomycetota bacterium]
MRGLMAAIKGIPFVGHTTIGKVVAVVVLSGIAFLPQCGGGPGQPGINWISPNNGPYTGGNSVQLNINTNGACGVNWVQFNGANAPIQWQNNCGNNIGVQVPSGPVNQWVCVVVNTAGGTSGCNWYHYNPTPPNINWINPNNGPYNGGNSVQLGINMNGACGVNWVQFNGANAPIQWQQNCGSTIQVTAPAGPPYQTVCVQVNTSAGTSNCIGYHYNPPRSWTTPWGISTSTQVNNPQVFTETAWFRVAPGSYGGGIISFGVQPTGNAGGYDRMLYVGWNGQLIFGVYEGFTAIAATPPGTIQAGQWYFAAATLSSAGESLYLDGRLVSHMQYTTAQAYAGYWRIGENAGPGWPWCAGPGCMSPFGGQIGQVSIEYTALSGQQIAAMYTASGASMNPNSCLNYRDAVFGYNPIDYWALTGGNAYVAQDLWPRDVNGSFVGNWGSNTLPSRAGLPGPLNCSGQSTTQNRSVQFNYTTQPTSAWWSQSYNQFGYISTDDGSNSDSSWVLSPGQFTLTAWVNYQWYDGGIIGFGSMQNQNPCPTGQCTWYDHMMWIGWNNHLFFGTCGVYCGGPAAVESPQPVPYGQWMFVAATMGPAGEQLYINGNLVATNTGNGTSSSQYWGNWRIGQLAGGGGWPYTFGAGNAQSPFDGNIAQVAVFPPLSGAQIMHLYQVGTS